MKDKEKSLCDYCNSTTNSCNDIEAGGCENYHNDKIDFVEKFKNIKLSKSKDIKIDTTLRVYENALKSYKSVISKNPDSQLKGLVYNIEYFINNIIKKNG